MKSEGERYTVAVDFDGVLHSYTSPWVSADIIPDPPVEGAMEWLLTICQYFRVVIFTTRGKTEEGRLAVQAWLQKHTPRPNMELWGETFEITAEKPPALIYLDDRAYRFEGPGTYPTSEQIHAAKPWNKR